MSGALVQVVIMTTFEVKLMYFSYVEVLLVILILFKYLFFDIILINAVNF